MAEALIRQRMEDMVKSIHEKDIDAVMSFYAPDIISFNFGPPLRYAGADNRRRAWQELFDTYPGPIACEVRDVNVTTQGELAFVHSVNQLNVTQAGGRVFHLGLRWTVCYRRIEGIWLIVHDHVSLPADIEHGQAILNLTPLSSSSLF